MDFIRQRLVTLKCRARDLQTNLRRWAMYDEAVSSELKEDLLGLRTPGESGDFDTEVELSKQRLRPVSTQLDTVRRWYVFVLEKINERFEQASMLLDQGRAQECLTVLRDVETRMIAPNEETFGYVFRSLDQHTSHEHHLKLGCLDTILRDLYLSTVKTAHERSVVSKEAMSLTPIAYFTESSEPASWREHARRAMNGGRRLPLSMVGIPRNFVSQPWNLVAIAHEVGLAVYSDIELSWEIANKLQTEPIVNGVSPQTAPIWSRWHETLFADIYGTLKLGPAYVSGMIELLGADPNLTTALDPNMSVPPPFIRWQIMIQTLSFLNFDHQVRELQHRIQTLCGDTAQVAARCGPLLSILANECRAITGVVAFSPCQRLAGARIVDIAKPFLATELQIANKVQELLLDGDESCSSDDSFSWVQPIRDQPVTVSIALAALRSAFDSRPDVETCRRLTIRFWCLMECLNGAVDSTRAREDKEYAPGDEILKSLAQQAVPVLMTSPIDRPVAVA